MPLNKTLLEDLQENAETLNIIDAAKRINIPWLIVQGDDDVNVPFENAKKLADSNPASRLVKIEGADELTPLVSRLGHIRNILYGTGYSS